MACGSSSRITKPPRRAAKNKPAPVARSKAAVASGSTSKGKKRPVEDTEDSSDGNEHGNDDGNEHETDDDEEPAPRKRKKKPKTCHVVEPVKKTGQKVKPKVVAVEEVDDKDVEEEEPEVIEEPEEEVSPI